jgi:CO/xanthine dehydrogenase Mo-binding subunit
MKNRADRLLVLKNESVGGNVSNSDEFVLSTGIRGLNIQTVGPISLFPHGRKCGIHFELDSTVTIILGMRDYGHGYVSPYFASLVATRLGIPLRQIRIVYSGAHPAVRITPRLAARLPSRGSVGTANAQIGALIQSLCEQAIEQGRNRLASLCGVLPDEIEFDAATGQFLVAGKEQRVDILELARWVKRRPVRGGGAPLLFSRGERKQYPAPYPGPLRRLGATSL